MNKKWILAASGLILITVVSMIIGASVQPQLTQDEQNIIVDAVVLTINPEAMREEIISTVRADVLYYLGIAPPTVTPTPLPPTATATIAATNAGAADSTGATQSTVAPESYAGEHAKFVNSYAYTVGGDSGDQKTFESEYTPNTLFNFDVVFENDGTLAWPPQVEMRNTGSVSTYTGHRPNVIIDTSNDPVLPGERLGFSMAAHGSEELGYHTFYFQLFDANSGVAIPGGYGYFSYLAK